MPSTDLAERLNGVHQRLVGGSRVASRDLFLLLFSLWSTSVAKSQPTPVAMKLMIIATDAILAHSEQSSPLRRRASVAVDGPCVWSLPQTPSTQLLKPPRQARRACGNVRTMSQEWSRHANHTADADIEIDARRISTCMATSWPLTKQSVGC